MSSSDIYIRCLVDDMFKPLGATAAPTPGAVGKTKQPTDTDVQIRRRVHKTNVTTYETVQDARSDLEAHIPPRLAREALNAVREASQAMLDEYDLADDVDPDRVAETLQRGFCEFACEWLESGTWDADDVRWIIDEFENQPVDNLMLVAGRVGFDNRDMVRVSEAIQSRRYS